MKAPFYIDTTTVDPTAIIGLQWEADSLAVINPTKYTVAVRVGSRSRPTTANADLVYAPTSALELPVTAREFCLTATTPILPIVPDNMPTRITILATKGEPRAAFGGIPLAGTLPAAGVLVDTASAVGFVNHFNLPVPSGIRRLLVAPRAGSPPVTVTINGDQTAAQYFNADPGAALTGHVFVPISALDTTISIFYAPAPANVTPYTVDVIGFSEYGPIGNYGQDGRQLVNPVAVGATTVPVSVAQFWPGVPVPSYDVNGAAFAPGAGGVLCATPAMAAGDYLVQIEMGSADPVAGGGKYLLATHNPGGKHQHYCPVPGHAEFEWHRVTAAAADVIQVQAGAAGGAGTLYFGAIRAYRIA